jgi:hypothetical protein
MDLIVKNLDIPYVVSRIKKRYRVFIKTITILLQKDSYRFSFVKKYIKSVFESPLDTFDGNRHKLNINLTKGILLREAERKVKFEKTNNPAPLPQIQEIKDSVSGNVNEKLTTGGVVEVRGYNLKIEGTDDSCGLWFVAENGAQTKAEVIVENKPSKIIAMIPTLPNGNYQVKVATQYSNSMRLLKSPKMFIYPKVLIVEN